MATTVEVQDEQIKPILSIRVPRKKRGVFSTANATAGSVLETVETTASAMATTMEIAAASLRQSLAETIAEGVQDLMNLGYTQEAAESILHGDRAA